MPTLHTTSHSQRHNTKHMLLLLKEKKPQSPVSPLGKKHSPQDFKSQDLYAGNLCGWLVRPSQLQLPEDQFQKESLQGSQQERGLEGLRWELGTGRAPRGCCFCDHAQEVVAPSPALPPLSFPGASSKLQGTVTILCLISVQIEPRNTTLATLCLMARPVPRRVQLFQPYIPYSIPETGTEEREM